MAKVFNDPVHGLIEIPALCVKIIDTPQFQRLRYIKQLGGCYFVYPGATHNRFEHSIGVCYLAGKLAKKLQSQKDPDLEISDDDVLCVQIAGLCHDLGHGPFSHLFDKSFIPETRKGQEKWKHEVASVDMFDHMLDANTDLGKDLSTKQRNFIKDLINPSKGADRSNKKSFLYEIVANKRTEVDVDKWDYFARDCHHLGMKNGFDHNRLIKFARVIEVKDESGLQRVICTRDKEVDNLYDMFHTRMLLHRRAYQHKTVKIIEYMIAEALKIADEHITIPIDSNDGCKMSETIDKKNMAAYTTLDDSIYLRILHSTEPNLDSAKKILERVESRNLYRLIVEAKRPQEGEQPGDTDNLEKRLRKRTQELLNKQGIGLSMDNMVISEVFFDYGMQTKDPVKEFYFYSKSDPNNAFHKKEVSMMIPKQFNEAFVRVYWKDDKTTTEDKEKLKTCVEEALESMTVGDEAAE
jgi:HD superfamily phosphohydrolase